MLNNAFFGHLVPLLIRGEPSVFIKFVLSFILDFPKSMSTGKRSAGWRSRGNMRPPTLLRRINNSPGGSWGCALIYRNVVASPVLTPSPWPSFEKVINGRGTTATLSPTVALDGYPDQILFALSRITPARLDLVLEKIYGRGTTATPSLTVTLDRNRGQGDLVRFVDYSVPDKIFLRRFLFEGNTLHWKATYVHCKAGRGRSTTIVVCYLGQYKQMTPDAAYHHVQSIRPRDWEDGFLPM
ncbi:hypothetical protein RJ639_017564 [Escallonia herrerae]|uniref:Tyrosine specific protein phosphatases domain-containing protein n=1 Tax=Escallonia herrerae TaxID=1293975 RepID=A0AA88VC50_9ASTE|nr:hypothetical protein RJ639_017564 [Escallonia herrerae]